MPKMPEAAETIAKDTGTDVATVRKIVRALMEMAAQELDAEGATQLPFMGRITSRSKSGDSEDKFFVFHPRKQLAEAEK